MVLSPRLYLPQSFFGLPLYIGVELILGIAILNKISGFYGILSLITGHPIDVSQWLFYLSSILILPFYINGLQNVKNPNLPKFSFISLIFIADSIAGVLFILWFSYQWFSANNAAMTTNLTGTGDGPNEPHDALKNIPTSVAGVVTATAGPTGVIQGYELEAPNDMRTDAEIDTQAGAVELEDPQKRSLFTAALQQGKGQLLKRGISYVLPVAEALVSRENIDAKLASQSASATYELMTTILTCVAVVVIRVYFALVVLSFTRLLLKSTKYGVNSDDFHNRDNQAIDNDSNGSKFKKWLHKMENKSVDVILWIFNE